MALIRRAVKPRIARFKPSGSRSLSIHSPSFTFVKSMVSSSLPVDRPQHLKRPIGVPKVQMAKRQVIGPAFQAKYVMASAEPTTRPLGVPAVQQRVRTRTADHNLGRPARLIDALDHARCAIGTAGSKGMREAGPITLVGQQPDAPPE